MVVKVQNLKVPHQMQKRLKGQEPAQWVGRLWKWKKEAREKNVLKLAGCIMRKEKFKNEPAAKIVIDSCYNKLQGHKNELSKRMRQKFEKLERYCVAARAPKEPLICPILLTEIEDPVATPCKHIFERAAICDWLLRKNECPLDRRPLVRSQLTNLNC